MTALASLPRAYRYPRTARGTSRACPNTFCQQFDLPGCLLSITEHYRLFMSLKRHQDGTSTIQTAARASTNGDAQEALARGRTHPERKQRAAEAEV